MRVRTCARCASTVFVVEQGVPAEIEWDALDPLCQHVVARDADGQPIGTGRLTPRAHDRPHGVLPEWRGRGVGEALLQALVEEARNLGWREVSLHAQVSALTSSRHGFVPYGARFDEAGIDHQSMRRRLDAGHASGGSRRPPRLAHAGRHRRRRAGSLLIYSRELDPGLLDQSEVVAPCAASPPAAARSASCCRTPRTPQRRLAPLLGLGQRLPTAFAFRAIEEPIDRDYPSAFVANDAGGCTSARWATASRASAAWTTRPGSGNCMPSSIRSGSGPARARNSGRWDCRRPGQDRLSRASRTLALKRRPGAQPPVMDWPSWPFRHKC